MTELQLLEQQLAYSAARADIECHAPMASADQSEGRMWYDTAAITDREDQAWVATAVRYLTLRGLLERHSKHDAWVRVIDNGAHEGR